MPVRIIDIFKWFGSQTQSVLYGSRNDGVGFIDRSCCIDRRDEAMGLGNTGIISKLGGTLQNFPQSVHAFPRVRRRLGDSHESHD